MNTEKMTTNSGTPRRRSTRTPSSKVTKCITITDDSSNSSAGEGCPVVLVVNADEKDADKSGIQLRRSSRKSSPTKRFQQDYVKWFGSGGGRKRPLTCRQRVRISDDDDQEAESESASALPASAVPKPSAYDLQLLEEDVGVAGRSMFGFSTPKKRGGMAIAAINTPKTPHTPKTSIAEGKGTDSKRTRKSGAGPKTPSHIRRCVKSRIAKLVEDRSESDFSADDSDFKPSESESCSSEAAPSESESDNDADDEPKSPRRGRRPIIVPVLPKTPSAARVRQTARAKKSADYIPESDDYFQSHSSKKILTSDHTLDRLKNPRLPADRLFSLLSEMKLSAEHESSIGAMMEEYRSYFPKWMYILNEGFNILVYGLGSKRQLLQSFHREVLADQTVLIVNGFFPSLTLKDILDSITNEILDAGVGPTNPHEAVDMIEDEFALIPDTHLYLIVHNLDGAMLRNNKAQSVLARLAKVPNIHLLASVDHINTPLLWDHTKLRNYNFSWWDCTTMLPYVDETAYENSLLVQNSGELALSSMRSVFLSLTQNSRGIYMIIVKHQLKNKGNSNYQGMAFKDLYWSCREAFLVSSDLALRAQLTEFLDHKLVKSKRGVDGSEQLTIPIEAGLLQQFLDEQEKK